MTRTELKASARESIKNCKTNAYIITIIFLVALCVISGVTSSPAKSNPGAVSSLISLIGSIITGILAYSYQWWTLTVARDNDDVNEIQNSLKNALGLAIIYIIVSILAGIGCLILIVPGIIISCGLCMAPYCYKDNIEAGAVEAIKQSWAMMNGHKKDFFVLILSFIPWILLGIITFGLGMIYVLPYMDVTIGKYYDSIK